MKTIQISEDILPLGEFKTQASRIIRKLKESNRPVIITLNGKPAAVMITPEDFDRFDEYQRFHQAVNQGLAHVREGKIVSDEDLDRELDAEFGPMEKK